MNESNVQPMKRSSIYATFGNYYGEKLYKLLYDCCQGVGSFCYEVKKCLGISDQGDSSKFLNQQGDWIEINVLPIQTYYEELIGMMTAGTLVPDTYYEFDFQTKHYIQFTELNGTGWDYGNEQIHTGNVERVKVKAISNTELSAQLESLDYPSDIIYWKPLFNDREWDAVGGINGSTGIIISREDIITRNKRDYDIRNVIARSWENVSGSGEYNSFFNTGFGYSDKIVVNFNLDRNVYIGSPLDASYFLSLPYWLDNTLVLDNGIGFAFSFNSKITWANRIKNILSGNATVFIGNYFDLFSSNIFSVENNNITGQITNNIINTFSDNDSNISDSDVKNCIINIFENNDNFQTVDTANIIDLSFVNFNGGYVSYVQGTRLLNVNFDNNVVLEYTNNIDIYLCSIVSDIKSHTFLNNNITNKTITPTLTMQSNTPTASRYDSTSGEYVEETLTAGVLSYSAPFTS
jgi:hypothetical protein